MKKILFCLPVIWLSACAGNPPAWWNPNGRYNQTVSQPASVANRPTRPVAKEENMDPLPDNSYEEETLTPLPEEDTPVETAEVEPALDHSLPTPSVLE